jgi:prolyl-tRNA editing enzyme YbaK/EbsC (Cys-tRNA(Pro) deacylase)
VGGTRHLRLATEDEIAARFGGFDVGATPPFGAVLGVPEIVDRHVLDHESVVCSAGDHQHAVKLRSDALLTVGAGTVADVCVHVENTHGGRFGDTPLH